MLKRLLWSSRRANYSRNTLAFKPKAVPLQKLKGSLDNTFIKNMETFNDVISADRLVLVDFFATWCGPCKAMHPVLENLKQQLGDRLRIIKVDVDKHQQTAAQYGVQAVPTLMLFRSGRQLWRQSGALPLPQLMAVVNGYL